MFEGFGSMTKCHPDCAIFNFDVRNKLNTGCDPCPPISFVIDWNSRSSCDIASVLSTQQICVVYWNARGKHNAKNLTSIKLYADEAFSIISCPIFKWKIRTEGKNKYTASNENESKWQ
ncbi:hypothetical protein CFP56_006469 [Quercus suber]|uniref:Uncharacterized protein n=1 Tax=Quercus suber TaxID=58331 RepID=A0AAW0L7P4_QUESU